MTKEEKQEMLIHLEQLKEGKLNTDDFGEQMEIADQIHAIEMKLNGVKPTDSYFECEGCGS